MVDQATPRDWRDADLTPLRLGAKAGDAGRAAQLDRLSRVVATQRGESYLMWLRLDSVADLIAELAPGQPAEAVTAEEYRRLLDPRTRLASELATEMATSRYAAEHLLDQADAQRHRIPQCGLLLRDGIISPRAFAKLVFETDGIIDPDLLAEVDRLLVDEIRASGHVAPTALADLARRIVKTVDSEGARTDREAAKKAKGVRTYPIRGGMAVLEITDSAEQIAMAQVAVEALAEAENAHDVRGNGERHADTAISLLTGETTGPGAKIVVHVVTDGSTLEGGDKPGHLDGHGAIDAGHVRDIAARRGTAIRPLDLTELIDHGALNADPYRPSAVLDTVVRALFGRCTWPGCSRPASRCQLDHVAEFNHADPDAGGATCWCNLNPKCVFHHQLKTFGDGWLDDQIIDAHGQIWTEVTTPHGRTHRTRAPNTWLLSNLGLLPCRHGPPTTPGLPDSATERTRTRTRTEAKHAYRRTLRAQNRTRSPIPHDTGLPSFVA